MVRFSDGENIMDYNFGVRETRVSDSSIRRNFIKDKTV